MGCGGSKDKTKDKKNDKKDDPTTAQPPVEQAPAAEKKEEPRKEVEAPAGRAQEDHMDTASTAAPKRPARSGDVDEDGNPVVLPKGEWIKTEGTPYYYSNRENLYYHPPSCQFYDPTNEMWYDPEKDEWYRDDSEDEDN